MLRIDTIGWGKRRVRANQDHVKDNDNNDDDGGDDNNYDNKKDNDGRDTRDFNISSARRRGTTKLRYICGKVREGARNRSLMKERVEQVQISAHTGVIHATVIALISKRASNNVLPRIDLTAQEKGMYTEEGRNMRPRCKAGAIV